MKAEALGCVVREYDPSIQLQWFIENIAEEIRVHSEIDDHFIRRLCDPTNVRVARL